MHLFVSHLMFDDDRFIFGRAESDDCSTLLRVFHEYEDVSGQQLNPEKSPILFSANSSPEVKNDVMAQLGISRQLDPNKYLGLPILFG